MPRGVYKRTKEHCRHISEAHMGKTLSEEHKRSIGRANKVALTGRTHSREAREAMSRALTGRSLSEEHKESLSRVQRGVPKGDIIVTHHFSSVHPDIPYNALAVVELKQRDHSSLHGELRKYTSPERRYEEQFNILLEFFKEGRYMFFPGV